MHSRDPLFPTRRTEAAFMREFARAFYPSKEWRRAREYIIVRDAGICVRCGRPGEIVHYKKHLTPENIGDLAIALGEDNLEGPLFPNCWICWTSQAVLSQQMQ